MIEFFNMLNACSGERAFAYLVFTLLAINLILNFVDNILGSLFSIFKPAEPIEKIESNSSETE